MVRYEGQLSYSCDKMQRININIKMERNNIVLIREIKFFIECPPNFLPQGDKNDNSNLNLKNSPNTNANPNM